MAAIHIYAHYKESPRVDDLCPQCHNPSLKEYTLNRIDMEGVTAVATRIACSDCHIWTSNLKELP